MSCGTHDTTRQLDPEEVKCLDLSLVRSITFQDFMDALKRIRPSVSPHSLVAYEKWSVSGIYSK
ncbi:hypothetical protein SFRURICE_015602 [Spodoptera frugiperda]|nr:hypothetical protein SFRURICE_015602 [Spodoptera frugiperda]